jgi:hypothetical protein
MRSKECRFRGPGFGFNPERRFLPSGKQWNIGMMEQRFEKDVIDFDFVVPPSADHLPGIPIFHPWRRSCGPEANWGEAR